MNDLAKKCLEQGLSGHIIGSPSKGMTGVDSTSFRMYNVEKDIREKNRAEVPCPEHTGASALLVCEEVQASQEKGKETNS